MNHIHNRALLINLTEETSEIIETGDAVYRKFFGGRGMCGYYLNRFLEDDPIIFHSGLFAGTDISGSGRCSVAHVSPHTGGLFRSDFGGDFSISLKHAGYDGLIITGKLEEKKSIIIDHRVLLGRAPDRGYSSVTPGASAWEGVTYAGIICDGSFNAHRGSTGYALAQKNIESVCIKLPEESEPETLSANEDIERLINASPALTGRLGICGFGTAALYDLAYSRKMLPHNFFGSVPDGRVNAHSFLSGHDVIHYTCAPCGVGCKKNINGEKLPEYDDFAALSAVGLADAESFYECFSKGYDAVTLAHNIDFYRKNIRDDDPKELLMNLNRYKELKTSGNGLSVKGLEIPSLDPRGACGVALGYASATNGADYMSAMAHTHEILRKPVPTDRHSFEGKAYLNYTLENVKAALDSLVPCSYMMFAVSAEEYAKALTELTGEDFSSASLAEAGENIWMNEIQIIRRLDIETASDILPDVFFSEGANGHNPLDRGAFDKEMKRYHRLRGLL